MMSSKAQLQGAMFAALLAVPFTATAVFAADAVTTLGAGAEYSSGKYGGTDKTEIFYLPLTAKYETGPWILRATVPYVRITGPGNVVGAGADRVTLPGAPGPRRTDSGLGDIVASAFYNVMSERTGPFGVDLGAKVKLGTADEKKGLGTGKNDYSLQADLFKLFGSVTAFGSLGYRWYGDPAGVDLRNVPYGSVGASYRQSADTSFGLAYDYRPRITTGGSHVSEATAFVSQRVSRDVKLQLYAVKGFSKGSPDFGLGTVLNFGF
jgi:hypothetical protein